MLAAQLFCTAWPSHSALPSDLRRYKNPHNLCTSKDVSTRDAPVMYDAAGDAKKTAIWPISSGSPIRPRGVRDSILQGRPDALTAVR